MKVQNYLSSKEILKHKEFEAVPVTVDDGVTAVNGKKILKAGTIIGGKTQSVLINRQEPIVSKNKAGVATTDTASGKSAEGILLVDVDVTDGPQPGTMVIRGTIDLNKIPETPCADAQKALGTRILFMK
ncbi:MAG: hypothetical protein N4A40_00435 [Tissierellales bacterium]|jgi:hypothetical protein|nr:hypothetical protein [Tissierellales bacterium]